MTFAARRAPGGFRPGFPGGPFGAPPLLASPCATRIVVPRVPLLGPHRTPHVPATEPDLILRTNRVVLEMDVVLHFHGFSGNGPRMRLAADKEPISGLDFCNPDAPAEAGRARPTLGILPRGNPAGGPVYRFPELLRPGAIDALITFGLSQIGGGGPPIRRGRLIITGHSGGGVPTDASIALVGAQLSEVHVFDGLYSPSPGITHWALHRLAQDALGLRGVLGAGGGAAEVAGYMSTRGSALRVVHRTGDRRPNTEGNSAALATRIAAALRRFPDVAPWLCRYYRVEAAHVGHNGIPRFYGFRLLRDAGGDVPRTYLPVRTCPRPVRHNPHPHPAPPPPTVT